MTPRGWPPARAAATSSAALGDSRRAAVGAVRPQPARSVVTPGSGGSPGIDAQGEQRHPRQPQDLEGAVAEDDLLRSPAPPGVEDQGVAEDGDHERDDRELEV